MTVSFRDLCLSKEYLDLLGFDRNTTGIALNVTNVVLPGTTVPSDRWTYLPVDDWPESFGSSLSIECPVPLCVFPMSSTFGSLRRVLFYAILAIAIFTPVSRYRILQRIAVIGLSVFTLICSFYFAGLGPIYHDPQNNIVELDVLPTFFAVVAGSFVVACVVDYDAGLFGRLVSVEEFEDDRPPQPIGRNLIVQLHCVVAYTLMLFFSFIVNIAASQHPIPARMVTTGNGVYRLTSSCYLENGRLSFWDSVSSFTCRDIKELILYHVPIDHIDPTNLREFVDATLGAISPVSTHTIRIGVWVTIGVVFLALFTLKGPSISGPDSCMAIHSLPIGKLLCRCPESLKNRLPLFIAFYITPNYRMPFDLVKILFIFHFILPLVVNLSLFAIALELGIWRYQTPVVETAKTFGQWGPVVGFGIVFFVVITKPWVDPPLDRSSIRLSGDENVRFQDYLVMGQEGDGSEEANEDDRDEDDCELNGENRV